MSRISQRIAHTRAYFEKERELFKEFLVNPSEREKWLEISRGEQPYGQFLGLFSKFGDFYNVSGNLKRIHIARIAKHAKNKGFRYESEEGDFCGLSDREEEKLMDYVVDSGQAILDIHSWQLIKNGHATFAFSESRSPILDSSSPSIAMFPYCENGIVMGLEIELSAYYASSLQPSTFTITSESKDSEGIFWASYPSITQGYLGSRLRKIGF